jgi:redox-sensitive bicupin YhaK (pirin superfamily)
MRAPWYRDFKAADVPAFTTPAGASVRVIAGTSHGVAGAVQRAGTEPLYLDVTLPPGATFSQPLPAGHNAFLYPYRGKVATGGRVVATRTMAIFANDADSDGVTIDAAGDEPARFILIAGRPLQEPIAQYGPFVMNTQEELRQAVEDFRAGRLGEEAHAG